MTASRLALAGLGAAAGLLLACLPALAARSGVVGVDQAAIRSAPFDKAPVRRQLPRGTRLEASNEPIEGYHKVRLADGEIGFVASGDLELAPMSGDGGGSPDPVLGPRAETEGAVKHATLRAGAGLGFGHFGSLNSLIGFDRFSNPFNGSLEAGIKLHPSWMLLVGGDYSLHSLTMSGTLQKSTSTVTRTYAFSESAIVARVGAAFLIVNEEGWLMEAAVMGAIAPSIAVTAQLTAADATDVSTASPNTTTLSGMGFGGVARLLVERRIVAGLGLTVEGGFRFVQSASVTPASEANGSDLFKEDNAFVAVPLQLTGFYAQAGLSWAF